MKYEAVIFDLFGTLVDSFRKNEYEHVTKKQAETLDIAYDDFRQAWHDTADKRNTGIFPTTEASVAGACEKLNIQTEQDAIKHAAELRRDYILHSLAPRNDTLHVLTQLRIKGFKTGLISNCSPDAAEVWDKTPFSGLFDATVFSSSAGLKKPDPRIYRMVLDRLGVKPESCLYIGDGDSNELTGAREIGMHPVMIRVDYEVQSDIYLVGRQQWNGPVINSLSEVMRLIGEW